MMEDDDKTTAEEIRINPTEKSSSICTSAVFFSPQFSSQCVHHRPVIDSLRLHWSLFAKQQFAIKEEEKSGVEWHVSMSKHLSKMFPFVAPLAKVSAGEGAEAICELSWNSGHEKSIFRKGYGILPVHRHHRKKNTLSPLSSSKNKAKDREFVLPPACLLLQTFLLLHECR